MTGAPQKFAFDTVFDNAGEIADAPAPRRRLYPADEVEAIAAAARAEGERAALASVEARQAEALATIADACRRALPTLAEVAHEHRVGAAELALACGRAIAAAALDRFPEAPLRDALDALAREIEAAPRLVVSVPPDLAQSIGPVVAEVAGAAGFSGAVRVQSDGGLSAHAFSLDFGDGRAVFDPAAAAGRVAEALRAALAAEGLHAEPLIPGGAS